MSTPAADQAVEALRRQLDRQCAEAAALAAEIDRLIQQPPLIDPRAFPLGRHHHQWPALVDIRRPVT